MAVTLRCTAGPYAGQVITVEGELVLGREQTDPGRLGGDARLSRRHARIAIDDSGRPVVEDLGSTNGTWVNDEQLTAPRVCSDGDVLRVGQSTFDIEVPPPPPPAAALTQTDTILPAGSPTVAEAPQPSPVLRVTAGPRQGEEIPLDHELLLGRSHGEPGALGGDPRLSRRHARIARGPGGLFFIEDTGSSNGTSVNGVLLRRVRALRDGDEIAVGSSKLVALGMPAPPVHAPEAAAYAPAPEAPPAYAPAPEAPPAYAREAPPVVPEAPPVVPDAPDGPHFAPRGAAGARLSSHRGRIIGLFAAVFVAAAAVAVAAVVLTQPLGSRSCPSGFICHPPPTAPPLHAATSFTGSLGWRVEYDPEFAKATKASVTGNEVVLQETSAFDQRALGAAPNSDLIGVVVRGYRTSQMSPTAAVDALASQISQHLVGTATAPSSDQFFERPALGFHPAVGKVLEGNAQTPQGPGPLVKVAVMSAASGGVTIAFGVVYPIQRGQTQGENPNRAFDEFGDQVVGTVRFPSDGTA